MKKYVARYGCKSRPYGAKGNDLVYLKGIGEVRIYSVIKASQRRLNKSHHIVNEEFDLNHRSWHFHMDFAI